LKVQTSILRGQVITIANIHTIANIKSGELILRGQVITIEKINSGELTDKYPVFI